MTIRQATKNGLLVLLLCAGCVWHKNHDRISIECDVVYVGHESYHPEASAFNGLLWRPVFMFKDGECCFYSERISAFLGRVYVDEKTPVIMAYIDYPPCECIQLHKCIIDKGINAKARIVSSAQFGRTLDGALKMVVCEYNDESHEFCLMDGMNKYFWRMGDSVDEIIRCCGIAQNDNLILGIYDGYAYSNIYCENSYMVSEKEEYANACKELEKAFRLSIPNAMVEMGVVRCTDKEYNN